MHYRLKKLAEIQSEGTSGTSCSELLRVPTKGFFSGLIFNLFTRRIRDFIWNAELELALDPELKGAEYVFRDLGFPFFEARDSGFESKIGLGFGIESIGGRWDAKTNPWD